MGFWTRLRKPSVHAKTPRGIAAAALAGAAADELCREACAELDAPLRAHGAVERLGIWLAPLPDPFGAPHHASFEGRVWNVGSPCEPGEWSAGELQALFPKELLGAAAPLEVEHDPGKALLGPASGMARILWVPLRAEGHLLGVLFAATRKPAGRFPGEVLERVASQLVLALAFHSRGALARARLRDLALTKRIWKELAGPFSLERVLEEITASALAALGGGKRTGPFAMLGLVPGRPAGRSTGADRIEFRWTAGDAWWARSAMSEPISAVWRRAFETGDTAGQELSPRRAHHEVSRVVAVPISSGAETAGVLVVGLSSASATLTQLEHLELHARLASAAITLSTGRNSSAGLAESCRFLLVHGSDPLFLLNERLEITGASEAGKRLAAPSGRTVHAAKSPADEALGSAAQLFRAKDWPQLAGWLGEIARTGAPGATRSIVADLRAGRAMRLLAAALPDGGLSLALRALGAEAPRENRAADELQSLMEWLDEGVAFFDESENLRASNLRFSQCFGLTPEELQQAGHLRELIELVAPRIADSPRFAEQWWDAVRGTDSSLHQEIQVLRPVARLLDRTSRPVLDANGFRIGRLEIYRDRTTQQVLQAKTRKTERLAVLGQRVSGIAHELSNPLTTILGYAQRMVMKPETANRREEVRRIFSEAERASSILRQLLGSAREAPVERQAVALKPLILRTVELQRFQLASDKIRIELDLAPSLAPVFGDPGQLQQVLMNLIANSRYALLEQGRPGTISIRTRALESGRVELEVSDSGPGIPEEHQQRVFDPFFTTKPAGLGTGLGLSIVRGLVQQHHGSIQLSSAPGRGTRFMIDFPPAQSDLPLLLPDLPPALSSPAPLARGGRVLVVEDEPTVAQLIADLLADLGYRPQIEQDARQALVAALDHDFALVVCDMKMPGLDGPHFYRALSEAGSPLTSRFLFVTGDVLGVATQEFLKQNRLPHIAKPFRVEEFTEKVALVLAGPARASSEALARSQLMNHR